MSDTLFKIMGLCIIGAVICISLKGHILGFAFLVSVAAGAVAVFFVFENLSAPVNQIRQNLEGIGSSPEYFKIALKSVGMSYISTFVAEACRECGQTLLATTAETAGKCAILYTVFPLILSISETAIGFIR